MNRAVSILSIALFLSSSPNLFAGSPGKSIADFTLKAVDGNAWSLDKQKNKAIVVVFIGTQCPVNNAYMPKLVETPKRNTPQGRAVCGHQCQRP